MIHYYVILLKGLGATGLFIVMAMEGASIPFPGIIVILSYGYILNPSSPEILWLAIIMSLFYTLFSFIPYFIGNKLEERIRKVFESKLVNTQRLMKKYGEWSIALTRPFGIGNYISYLAGITRVKPLKYSMLTFIGIFPWCIVTIFLGKLYKGNVKIIMEILKDYAIYEYIAGGIIILIYFYWALILRKRVTDTTN